MSKLPSTSLNNLRHAATRITPTVRSRPPFDPSSLLHYQYTPDASFNDSILYTTHLIISDPSHPYHTRAKRRQFAFDSTQLHWRVQCPVDVSKKAFIRNWATRRVRNAFAMALRGEEDINPDAKGSSQTNAGSDIDANHMLTGSLSIFLTKDKLALTASNEEVRASAAWLLRQITKVHDKANNGGQSGRRMRATPTKPVIAARSQSAADGRDKDVKGSMTLNIARPTSSDSKAIRTQLEFYFSDANLAHDRFLVSLMDGTANKPIPLKTVHSFKRMRKFQPYEAVREAVKGSEELVLDEEDGIRRRVPLGAAVLSDGNRLQGT